METANRRAQLAEFLKSRRARVTPGSVGLPESARRRTPGLRREDVAALAGLSATWYAWLEQGRDIHASDRVLEGLSDTLRLSPEERDYLFSLAQSRPAPLKRSRPPELPAAVRRTLESLNVPALVMTPRWDVIAWNAMMTRTIRDYGAMAPEERNLLRILLVTPEERVDEADYEAMARRIVAKFHVDYSQAGPDPAFEALVDELNAVSPAFRRLWRSPEILGRSEGVHLQRHPERGDIRLEHTSYVVEGAPLLRVVIYAPHDPESAAKLAALAREP
jgi:hypothetical protein